MAPPNRAAEQRSLERLWAAARASATSVSGIATSGSCKSFTLSKEEREATLSFVGR